MPPNKRYLVIVFVSLSPYLSCSDSDPIVDTTFTIEESMSDEEFLDKMSDIAFGRMDAVGGDPTRLEEPYKTVAIVYSAQEIIDNGGLRYFFENDWPHNPPYSEFADAYQRIGRVEAANALRSAAASFGINRPELHCDARRAYIEKHYDAEKFEIRDGMTAFVETSKSGQIWRNGLEPNKRATAKLKGGITKDTPESLWHRSQTTQNSGRGAAHSPSLAIQRWTCLLH